LPPPLSFFAAALSAIDHSTGHIWLDATSEAGFGFEWSQDNLQYLAEEWRLAQEFRQQYEALVAWLEEDPAHQKQVIDLWNSAAVSD
jgi:hypothetical protein